MLALLDGAAVTTAARWMRIGTPRLAPGRHVPLTTGVLAFYPHRVNPVSVLDIGATIPVPEVEPVQRVFDWPDWHEWALCNGDDSEKWFSEDRRKRVTLAKEARRICLSCPVITECLMHALAEEEEFGIWAGTSGRRRAQMQERILAGETTVEQEVAAWLTKV